MTNLSEELLAENERLRSRLAEVDVPPQGTNATLFVWVVVILSVLGIVAVLVVFVVRPDTDNIAINTTIISIVLPLITAFLAAALRQVHLDVNSRLTQFLKLTQKASRAEGKLAGIAEVKIDNATEKLTAKVGDDQTAVQVEVMNKAPVVVKDHKDA